MDKFKIISVWLWFGLILSLVPIFLVIWKLCYTTQFPTIYQAGVYSIKNGELLLLSIAAIGASMGELFKGDTKYKTTRIWIAGFGLVLFLFATMSYDGIREVKLDKLVSTSIVVFFSMIAVTLAILILPKND